MKNMKEDKINKGIYIITCLITGKYYIGSVGSEKSKRTFSTRFNEHKSQLRKNIHKNSHLQNAWNIYGEDYFQFCVLQPIEDVSKIIGYEIYWIEKLDARNKEKGFNICYPDMYNGYHSEETKKNMSESHKGLCSNKKHYNYGRHLSEETKQKISESNKGKQSGEKHPMYGKPRAAGAGKPSKSVICIETGIIYESINEASKMLNCNHAHISACCRKMYGRKTVNGYHWKYNNENKE